MTQTRELTEEKCRALLRGNVVGRVALCRPDGRPTIVPVNYAMVEDAVIIRTTAYSLLGGLADGALVAFEVDHLDHDLQRAWSVVVSGRIERVESPAEVDQIRTTWNPRPWAGGGTRLLYLRIRADEITGRAIGEPFAAKDETPVRRVM